MGLRSARWPAPVVSVQPCRLKFGVCAPDARRVSWMSLLLYHNSHCPLHQTCDSMHLCNGRVHLCAQGSWPVCFVLPPARVSWLGKWELFCGLVVAVRHILGCLVIRNVMRYTCCFSWEQMCRWRRPPTPWPFRPGSPSTPSCLANSLPLRYTTNRSSPRRSCWVSSAKEVARNSCLRLKVSLCCVTITFSSSVFFPSARPWFHMDSDVAFW